MHQKGNSIAMMTGLLGVLLVCFSGISGHDLWTPDEPRVAAIALEMAETADFVVPRLSGEPFVEKPPLYFAVSALMLRAFSSVLDTTTTLRLTAALFGIGVLIMTFLLAKRILGVASGIFAMLVLGTMEGFVENFHWIRVDAALAFFVISAIWCFLKAVHEEKPAMLLPAGVLSGCALLSKGLIAPLLISAPVLGLACSGARDFVSGSYRTRSWITGYCLCLISFAAVCCLWMIPFYLQGDRDLWNEWFWVNNAGRFAGTAAKAHMKPGEPFYYVVQLIMYSVPWTPWIFFWFIQKLIQAVKNRTMDRKALFLMAWGPGSLMLLTLSTTKRGIYMTPLLPAFAIIAAAGISMMDLQTPSPRWGKWYTGFWNAFCLLLLGIVAVLPVIVRVFPGMIPAPLAGAIIRIGWLNGVSVLCLASGIAVVSRYGRSFSQHSRLIVITALLYISVLGVPITAMDSMKSMKNDIRQFAAFIPATGRDRIAGMDFSETMLGCFYYYCGWKVPQINDRERIRSILEGRDSEFSILIVNRRKVRHAETELSEFSYILLKQAIISNDRGLFLIQGNRLQSRVPVESLPALSQLHQWANADTQNLTPGHPETRKLSSTL